MGDLVVKMEILEDGLDMIINIANSILDELLDELGEEIEIINAILDKWEEIGMIKPEELLRRLREEYPGDRHQKILVRLVKEMEQKEQLKNARKMY